MEAIIPIRDTSEELTYVRKAMEDKRMCSNALVYMPFLVSYSEVSHRILQQMY